MSIFIGRDPSPPPVARPKPAAKLKPIVWAAWACLALGVSGLVRSWQDSRLVDAAQLSEAAPFPLKELPLNIEGWTYRTDVDESLDVARWHEMTRYVEHHAAPFESRSVDDMSGRHGQPASYSSLVFDRDRHELPHRLDAVK